MWQPILMINGYIISILGLCMLIPAAYDLYFLRNGNISFAIAAGVTVFVGMGMFLSNRGKISKISIKQGYLITVLSWFLCALFASLPFLIQGSITPFCDAFFEAVSGISGTGATILPDIEKMPRSALLWRSMLNALGGIGIVIFAAALLPFLGIGGMQIFQRENSDIDNKFMPKFSYIAKRIIAVFLSLILLCCVCLHYAGMDWFDAVNHAMTAVATGGFSTKNDSIAFFASPKIEFVLCVFMVLGALPMTFYVMIWQNRELKSFRTPQIMFFLKTLAVLTVMLFCWLVYTHRYGFFDALRYALFNVISVVTTTGYSSADFLQWGSFAVAVFFIISFCGGCTGSTAGSVKILRWEILWAYMKKNLISAAEPNRIIPLKVGEKNVDDKVVSSVYVFLSAFGLTAVVGIMLLAISGTDLFTSIGAVTAAITNVGPGVVKKIGPKGNYAEFCAFAKYVLSAMMMLGRLEIITVLVIFSRSFWQK